jgi:hypothetical protein
MSDLTLTPKPPTPNPAAQANATREAWTRVTEGMLAALDVPGLPAYQRAKLTRCYRLAARRAGLPALSLADDEAAR